MALENAGGLVDGTTAAPDVTPRDTGVSQVSGPTHKTSGDSQAPDPTGLRGTIQKNYAAVQDKIKAAGQAAVTEQNDSKAKPDATVSRETKPTAVSDGTQRGPDGKFLPKGAALPEPTEDAPPSTWRAETKALWKEIDLKFGPEHGKLLKDELRKREGDFRSGIKAKDDEVATIKSFHETLNPVIAPRMSAWQQMGITPSQAIANLVGLEARFQSNPVETLKWLANAAKIDLSTLAGGSQQAAQTVDPQLAPVLQEVNGLKSQLNQFLTERERQTTAATTAEIQSIMDEKGADGLPVRPYFNDVFSEVQAEMQLLRTQHPDWGARQVVTAAYDTAIWRNPDVRQKMIEGTTAQKRAAEATQQRQTAAELAAKQVRGGPPNAMTNGSGAKDLRGMLEQRVGALYSGGQRI